MNPPDIKVTGRVLTYSPSTIARNRELFGGEKGTANADNRFSEGVCTDPAGSNPARPARPSRIRQSSKPKSNQLEAEFGRMAKSLWPNDPIWEKGLCFRLANGCVYWPDWVVWNGCTLICHEIKGKKAWDDAIVKLKVAATTYPQFEWYLQDKPDGQWREYRVLP